MDLTLIIVFSCAYLLGAIPGALIVCKAMELPDPRHYGSENPGSTNVARIGGKKAGFLTFLLDGFKGLAAILLAQFLHLAPWTLGVTALCAGLGHCYPFWSFKQGGKGMATFFGCLCGISLINTLIMTCTWLIVTKISRYVSLATMLSSLCAVVCSIWFGHGSLGLALFSLLIFWRHKSNIHRLMRGTEPAFSPK